MYLADTDEGISHHTPLSMQTADGYPGIDSFPTGDFEVPFQAIPLQNNYHDMEAGFNLGGLVTSHPVTSGQGLRQHSPGSSNLATVEPIMSTFWSQFPLTGVHGATPIVTPPEQYIAQWDQFGPEANQRPRNDHLAHLSFQDTPSFYSLDHVTLPGSRQQITCATSDAGVQSLATEQPEYPVTSPATSKTDCSPPSSPAASKATEEGEQESIRVVKLEEATSQNRPTKLTGWVRIESEKDGTVYVIFGWPPSKPRGDPVRKYKGVQSYLQRLGRYHRGMSDLLGQEDTLVKQLIHLASLFKDPTSKLHLLLSSGVLTELSVKLSVLLERCLDYEEPGSPTSLRGNWKTVKDQQKRMHLLKERLHAIDLALKLTTRWGVDWIVMMNATWSVSDDDP